MEQRTKRASKAREVYGIIGLALAFFLFLSLVSYQPGDPSFTHYVSGSLKTKNIFGALGSYTSDALIKLIGLSALMLPIIFLIVAFKYFLDDAFKTNKMLLLGIAGLLFSSSGLIALVLSEIRLYGAKIQTGGLLGSGTVSLFHDYLNGGGTFIFLFLILVLSLVAVVDLSVVSAGQKTVAVGKRLLAKWKSARTVRIDPVTDERTDQPKAPYIEEMPVPSEKVKRKKIEQIRFDFVEQDGVFNVPPLSLLDDRSRKDTRLKRESLLMNSRILEKKLSDFGVEAKVIEVKPGPVITMYEMEPAPGVKINKITNLTDDLALALRAPSIRIVAPIPGKAAIGIEIPNNEREAVHLRDVLDNEDFQDAKIKLPIALGEDIVGAPVVADLVKMPHLLIAGTTGSGKSVSLNAMICSMLFKCSPDEVKFLMIDPKRLELSSYEGIPHLLHPVVVDAKKASLVLKWAVEEMERRYVAISELGVKGIDSYNKLLEKNKGTRDKLLALQKTKAGPDDGGETQDMPAPGPVLGEGKKLPYVVIIIDELADLMMVASRNVEESLARLAQMARAAGIHLILATQRPSVDVITGVIKANFPTRISFQVSSKVDSRTILDQLGAENLLGAGDMLFMPPGTAKITRIHGAYVSEKEIDRIVSFIRKQRQPDYDRSLSEFNPESSGEEKSEEMFDEKYDAAVELVTDLGQASISLVQRYMKIGYNRAARIIERMESEGVVGPSDGVKPRKVLARKLSR
ncbi:MAG: DNA translocase FtsK [Syntrophus sp. SKADARSKE-3]|nr:DNA translocase FtsK [Syntrophus sp. SKADARSKE-3]